MALHMVGEAADVVARHLELGLADASIVVLAERYETNRVLTLDHRHFRALRTSRGTPFAVLPADCELGGQSAQASRACAMRSAARPSP